MTTPAFVESSRIRFRQPVSESGFVDAAWWPRSLDLAVELPPLLDVLWSSARDISRITYNITEWGPTPRRLLIDGRTVRLGGFTTGDRNAVRLTDAWRRERIDVLVIPPTTDSAQAERAMTLASNADNPYRGAEILSRAQSTNMTDER